MLKRAFYLKRETVRYLFFSWTREILFKSASKHNLQYFIIILSVSHVDSVYKDTVCSVNACSPSQWNAEVHPYGRHIIGDAPSLRKNDIRGDLTEVRQNRADIQRSDSTLHAR